MKSTLKKLGTLTLLAVLGSALPGLAQAYTAPLPGKVFKDCPPPPQPGAPRTTKPAANLMKARCMR